MAQLVEKFVAFYKTRRVIMHPLVSETPILNQMNPVQFLA